MYEVDGRAGGDSPSEDQLGKNGVKRKRTAAAKHAIAMASSPTQEDLHGSVGGRIVALAAWMEACGRKELAGTAAVCVCIRLYVVAEVHSHMRSIVAGSLGISKHRACMC